MANPVQDPNQTTITSVGTATTGGTANSAKPAIVGTAQPLSTVEIFDGGRLIGIAGVDMNGNWTFAPSSNMSSGVHQFTALAIDSMGVFGPLSTPVSVSIPTPAPVVTLPPVIESVIDAVGPVQGKVPSGGTTDDNHPTISGTGIPGYTIYVYQNGLGCADTVVDSTGHWSVKVTGAMSEGLHNMTATQLPSGGAASVASNTWAITIDTKTPATPATPTLTDDNGATIPAGSTTNNNHPHINGTGVAGDIIKVYDGSTLIGSTTIGSNGKWTFTPGNMSAGAHSINVTETNAAGTTSAHSGSIGFTYSNVTPSPVITSVIDAVGPVQGNVPSGGTTDDAQPTIKGTGIPGDTLYIYLANSSNYGGQPYGAGDTVVDANGNWSIKLNKGMPSGLNTITATQFLGSGPHSAASAAWAVTVDTSTPATPAAPTLTNDSGASIPVGSTTNTGHPHINGTGKAGDIIKVYDGSTVIGSTTIGSNGQWTFTPSSDLSTGTHSINVTETNAAGTPSAHSGSMSFTYSTLSAPTETATIGYLWQHDGAYLIASGGAINDTAPWLRGSTSSRLLDGETLVVYRDGVKVGNAQLAPTFTGWDFFDKNVGVGNHYYEVRVENSAGSGPMSSRFTFTEVAPTPVMPTETVVITNLFDHLVSGNVYSGGSSKDTTPLVGGTLSSGLLAGEAVVVYRDGSKVGNATVSGKSWTYQDSGLSVGSHFYEARVETSTGYGPTSNHFTFSEVAPTPVIPTETVVITNLFDHLVNGNVYSGGSSKDTTPLVGGTLSSGLLAGEAVVVYRDGSKVGNATVSGKSWTYQDSGLGLGSHFYEARVESSTGYGPTSNHFTFSEVSAVPAAPQFSVAGIYGGNVPAGSAYPAGGVIVSGTTAPGTIVTVYMSTYRDGRSPTAYGTLTADTSGHWSKELAWNGMPSLIMATATVGGVISPMSSSYQVGVGSLVAAVRTVQADDMSHAAAAGADQDTQLAVQHTATVDPVQPAPSTDQHTVVAEHGTFVGKAGNGNETVDLNVDPASYFKETTAHIQGSGGTAIDTLHLTGDHQVLDLTSLTGKTAAAKISGIEVVDLGGQHNTLKLSLIDVLNLGETDLFQKDGKQQMMVQGKDGDTVDLSNAHITGLADGEWAAHGTAVVGGVTYNVYEHSGAHTELLVQQGVQIVVH